MRLLEKLKERMRAYGDAHNFTCDVCGREVFAGERVCAPCNRVLPWNDKVFCPLCGRREKEEGICLECKAKRLPLAKARSAFVHEGEAARLVVRFKRGEKYLYRTLCDLMEPVFEREFSEVDLIASVPMTKRAMRARGYDQARLLAEEMAKRYQIEYYNGVQKTRETAAQKFLSRRDREKNLEGCFHVHDRRSLKGKRVLLIDDTLTTGATLGELAGVLLRAGAREVCALTVTSTEYKRK